MRMPSHYQMLIDNLLDLSHAPYLHSGTLSPIGTRRETNYEATEFSVKSNYKMPSVEAPASQRLLFDEPVGDYYTSIDWTAPSVLRQSLCFTGVGRSIEEGAVSRGAHISSPESEKATHYFWVTSRSRRQDDQGIDRKAREFIENAFTREDGPMVEACEGYMGTPDLLSLSPIFLQVDTSAVKARRILNRMMRAESGSIEPS
jgi:phenylpropionate dioxygenase-like ring-hydroxylating dioxygenase large terminal subunit